MSSRTGPVTWCDHENSTGVKFLRALHSALRSRNRMGARNRTGPASSGLAMNNQPNHCITGSLWEENQPMRRFPNEEFVKVFLCHEVIRWWIALKIGVYFDPLLHNERAQVLEMTRYGREWPTYLVKRFESIVADGLASQEVRATAMILTYSSVTKLLLSVFMASNRWKSM